jgi:hypothetical protein
VQTSGLPLLKTKGFPAARGLKCEGWVSALTGNVLLDPGPAGLNNLALMVVFSAPQTSISLNFATNSVAGVLFNLNAFSGASAVGSAAASGVIPLGFSFPEGVISFSGPAFDRVVLSSSALDFAIDNVTVDAIPEPGALSLLTLGMLGSFAIAWLRRRGAYGEKMSSRTRIHAD